MKINILAILILISLVGAGCGHEKVASGPVPGTLKLDNLTPEEQIAKVQADNTIPDNYKQTFINSIRARQGQPAGQGAAH